MSPKPTTLIFDYGNTLIAFGPAQQSAQKRAMRGVLMDAFGSCDEGVLEGLRKEQVMRPYKSGYVENVWEEVCAEVVERQFPGQGSDDLTREVMRVRHEAFLETVVVSEQVVRLLEQLAPDYRLGLLSNYPCTDSILHSLERLGLRDFFETVVVSAEVGRVKPHAEAYEAILGRMNVTPEESVYIGDNWLADIQGAKRMGMRAVLVKEHVPYETFAPKPGDYEPDASINRVTNLPEVLETWQ